MRTGARLQAAVEVLTEITTRHRPATDALSDWGKAHRFAGSSDRAVIGNLVFDALRRRSSLAARMQSDTPRALVIGVAHDTFGLELEALQAAADGSAHALSPPSDDEIAGLLRPASDDLPDHVRGDYPDWLSASFERAFEERAAAQGHGLAQRAPIDLRVNTLKTNCKKVLKALQRYQAVPTPFSPIGVRVAAAAGAGRSPNVEVEPGHGKGWYEVQDEGSQIAALLAAAGPGQQVLDLCAGAGGKTLALAAEMRNTGQVYAYDAHRQQLRPIFERLKRAGVRNVQVMVAGDEAGLRQLGPRFDLVLVDAPCTGSGVWRRRPDAKWRVKPANLAERQAEQRRVLDLAVGSVKPGGRLIYVTCSVLPEENTDIVRWRLDTSDELELIPTSQLWAAAFAGAPPASADRRTETLLLTPATHATDGFFIAGFRRRG